MYKIKKILPFFVLGIVVLVSTVVFALEENVPVVPPEKHIFLSPKKMIPFVSQKISRKNICALDAGGSIEQVCDKKYDRVRATDTEKIDELFVILKQVNDDGAPTELAKYLTTQLIFSTLPQGARSKLKPSRKRNLQTSVLTADADDTAGPPPPSGISRAEYDSHLEDELYKIRSNCPKPGDENWVFSAMCSEYKWINGVQEPIYSKQYAEYGGPCLSEAGQIEQTNIQSRVNTKMRSEYNFTDETGISSQIACSFSCASSKCPRYEEQEAERTQCKNPIYYPHFDKKWSGELSLREKRQAYENAKAECKDRSYDYVKRPDGTSKLKKVRNCKLSGSGSGELYQDPPDYRPIYVETYCCDCDRIERDPYVSQYNFNDPAYRGRDLLKKLMDAVTRRITDAPAQPPPAQPPPSTPPPSLPLSTPAPAPPPLAPLLPTSPDMVRFRFTCSIKETRLPDYYEVRLTSDVFPIDEKGDAAWGMQSDIHGGGQGRIGSGCSSIDNEVPICVDPRTGEKTKQAIDFIKEYSRKTQTAKQIGADIEATSQTMWQGKRKCTADEVPVI